MATRAEKACRLTPEDFRKILKYDPETGLFYWLIDIRVGKNKRLFRKAGDLAGGKTDRGYVVICVEYQHFYAHRLAWFMTFGAWPTAKLDHRNTIRDDNRLSNLRPATEAQNRSNTKVRARSGFKGVRIPKHAPNSFIAQITVRGERKYLGCFPSAEQAHAVYCKAATEAFGEFARFA